MASDRAFLKTNREPTPELMPGMDDDETGVRFKPIEDVSDSEEAEMDMSGDENSAAEQPKKKTRTVGKAADGDSVPRWSNPDPYTALPPPDESQRKKKDVVKLIRKARVETNSMSAAKIDAADDFISFDFDDEEKDELSERDPFSPERGIGVAGAPKGPRFSHVTNLHNQQLQAASPAAVSTRVTSQQVQPQINQPLQSRTNVQNVQGRVDNQTFQSRSNVQNVQGRTNHENSQVQVASQNIKPRNNNQNVQVQVNNETMRYAFPLPKEDLTLAKAVSPSKPVNVDTTSDPALGSRKRNIRDEIKAVKAAPVLHKVGKGASKKPVDGTVLKEWQATSSVSSAPWLEIDHSDTANMGLW
jgi:non-canonical poly(A) RNA polymerase PAPD5/7